MWSLDLDEVYGHKFKSSQVKAFVRTIDSHLEPSEPRAQMDALVDELMFPDYNENPGDGYQYFYDHFRRYMETSRTTDPAEFQIGWLARKIVVQACLRDMRTALSQPGLSTTSRNCLKVTAIQLDSM
ncbi:hypothetical protein T265_11614 [Opisthorchis viverrini]|uniref:Uncharacterized protein n=1 Tax=Opisthorchis viverrini TaxID=6198 RepID=A0A074YY35_OPIVI|nr:hypothetical protein T265_11614 [Opisthorchis viverrini]KER19676.1 hypothetical protein T265_11614 [Opisthorchis viverrini]